MTELLFNREVSVKFTDQKNDADVVTIEDPKISGREPVKIDFHVEKQVSTEPNRADIILWNLNNDTAAKINFRKPILEFKYGRKVDLFAGYEGRSRRIFSGVVIAAITSREGRFKITRVECRNIFYELMQLPVQKVAVGNPELNKGARKADFILDILDKIGATIDNKATELLINRLKTKDEPDGATFKETTNFKGTAYNVINEINRGLLGVVNIYFDDIAASFNPVGVPLVEPPVIYDKTNGLLGSPKPTQIGADFVVQLDNELKISSPVLLRSDTIESFFPDGRFVVKRVTHAGTNRADGDFESRVVSVFDRTKQYETTTAVA